MPCTALASRRIRRDVTSRLRYRTHRAAERLVQRCRHQPDSSGRSEYRTGVEGEETTQGQRHETCAATCEEYRCVRVSGKTFVICLPVSAIA